MYNVRSEVNVLLHNGGLCHCDKMTSFFPRKNSSTKLAALEVIDRLLTQLDGQLILINFYLDLSKAFDAQIITFYLKVFLCSCVSMLLVVPHQKSNKYSEKAFAVVGPRLWNELLTDELRGCNSVDTFKKKLKTMLFKKTLLTFHYVLLYVLLIFRDYVEICNSSVDGFTQHVSYFCCTID